LQSALGDWYAGEYDLKDPTVGSLTNGRSKTMRKYGFESREIAMFEIMLPVATITNSTPTIYWLLGYVFGRLDLVEKLRKEITPVIQRIQEGKDDVATIDIKRFETHCPLLVACYREAIRLCNHNVSMRRILTDTVIKDGNGNSYLLKEGVDLHIPVMIAHKMESVWGEDAAIFNPDRFLPGNETSPSNEKAKKNAYIPFGGGRHLCPGRNFAFAEILSIVSTMAVGFDVAPAGMQFADMKQRPALFASSSYKPHNEGKGLGLKLTRRKGWENTLWRYEC
jgi:cytochrome P450